MIRIFHPDHGYSLVTDDNEKKRLLETGGYISESFDTEKSEPENIEVKTEVTEPKRGRPKKWQ